MATKRYIRALFQPHEAFDRWAPRLRVAVGIIVVLCVLNGMSVAYTGGAIAGEVSGTVAVENPERPPDWVCEDSSFDTYGSCDAPRTLQEPLQPAASDALNLVIVNAVLAPLAWVLLLAALFVLISGEVGKSDSDVLGTFSDGARIAALAAVPGLVRYLFRPVAVERALKDWTHPSSIDGVQTAAVNMLFPDGPLWMALVLLSGLWSATIVYGGARAFFESEQTTAVLVAAIALITTTGSVVLTNDGWINVSSGIGFLLFVAGVAGLLGAYTFISISKSFELIGFSGSEGVTPRPWYVGLHRIAAVCALGLGFVWMDGLAVV